MEDEYFWPWYINNLWQRENSIGLKGIEGKGGYKKGRYFPYTTPNGNVDLGPGFDMDKQDDKEFVRKAYAEGFTKEELDKIATERLKSENGYFNQRIIKEGGDPASIGRDVRAGLLDMYWQLKNGIYGYDEFWKAVANKDYKKMREESATYYEPKNGNYPKDAIVKDGKILDEGRWDYRKKKYFHNPSFRTGTTSRWAEGGFLKPKDAWDTLSLKEKAEMMKVAVKNGIYDLQTIRNKYNEFAEGGDTEPLEYTHQRFPVTQEFEIYPYKDPSFTPEGMGNIEYMEAKHDTLPYYNNYQKPSNLKGKSVVVYNNKMGDATNEAIALDILSHGLREQDLTWREKYLPTLTDAFEGDALYNMTDEDKKIYNPNDPEERGEVIDNYIDGYIRTMAVGDKYRKALNYAPREVFNKEYNSLPPEQQNALAEAYSYIYPTQLPEVIVHGNKHSLGGTIAPITNIFKGGGYKPSTSVKKRISTWEGTAMTGAKDPLSGKRGKNRSFEAEADSFYDALPSSIRNQVLSNPNLADNLFSYSYNVGAGNFKKRVVPALERYYNGKGSAEEIANSMWASGDKKLRGLRKRRAVERKGVVDALSPAFMPQAADNTFMLNPYITQVENTQMLPIMVPDEDSYVTTHEVSPAEQKAIKFNAETEAIADYNRLMNTISILNNSQPEYTPANSIYTMKGLGGPIVEAVMNEYRNGGGIHIKPSHRGRLTELKKRTGKSEAELYRTGSPATRKMITFARSARKWKHGLGGNLFLTGGPEKRGREEVTNLSVWDELAAQSPLLYTIGKAVDPTGISGYGDAREAINQYDNAPSLNNGYTAIMETLGALPIVSKAGKAIKFLQGAITGQGIFNDYNHAQEKMKEYGDELVVDYWDNTVKPRWEAERHGEQMKSKMAYTDVHHVPSFKLAPKGSKPGQIISDYNINHRIVKKYKKALGGNLFSGEENHSNQMNIFRRPNGEYFYQASPDSEEVSVTPLNTLFDNPALWTYTDANGKLYTPRQATTSTQGTITKKEEEGPIIEATKNYLGELQYDINNGIPIGGKYTMPAIAASALLPLAGEALAGTSIAGIPATTWADAALTAGFGAHGLNHAINEGIDGWGDAAITALEVAPLGILAKPVYEGVVQPGMRLFNSPLTGNWTKIGNREYRLSPNSLGANGSPIESRGIAPQITAENAITRAQEIQELIPRYNKFAEYYGYNTVPEGTSIQEAENLIKEGLKQHNTFYRGLTYPEGEKLEAVKKVLGENASREEIMDYLAKSGSRDPGNTYFSLDERANQYARTGDVARYTRKYTLGDSPSTWLEDADFAFDTTPATSMAPKGSINYPWAGSYTKEAPGEVRINPEDVTFEGWMPKTRWEYGEYVKPSEYKTNKNLYFNKNAGGTKPTFKTSTSSVPTITAENAASMAPEQWDAAYRAAYEAGDMEEVQRLRDLHFMAKAPETAIASGGLPIHAYHGTGKLFNEFDTTGKYSTLDEGYYGVGAYFAPNKEIADMYANTERTPIIYDTYLNIKNPLKHVRDENADLYGKPIVNNDGVISTLPDDLIDPNFDMTEFVATKPNQIKKADAITYDDAGNTIPLSQRDNFALGDMRYGLLPFGIGLTGYGLFNNQEAFGGKIKKR